MPSIRVVVVGIENPAQNDASGPRHARVQLTCDLHDLQHFQLAPTAREIFSSQVVPLNAIF